MLSYFFKLATLAMLCLTLVGQSNAFQGNINSYSCSAFTWSITVTPAEYQAAYYAVFFVADNANADDLATQYKVVNSAANGGDITGSNHLFTFNANLPSSAAPGGTTWKIGVALEDQNKTPFSDEIAFITVPNPCTNAAATSSAAPIATSTAVAISTSRSAPTSTTSSGSSFPVQTSSVPAPTHAKKSKLGAIIGGIVGAIALLIAMTLFLVLRNRKAAKKAAQQNSQYNNYSRDASGAAGNTMEKGYISSAPIDSVNQLPNNPNSGVSDYIEKDTRMSDVPTMTSPPMSPRQSQWYAGGLPPVSSNAMSPPMSPTLSATSGVSRSTNPLFAAPNPAASAAAPMPAPSAGPVRSNNPLMNFNVGNWSAGPTAEESSPVLPQPQQSSQLPGSLPEPMSRH